MPVFRLKSGSRRSNKPESFAEVVEATTIDSSCTTVCPDKKIARLAAVRARAAEVFGKCLRRLPCLLSVRNLSRNASDRRSLCPYRPRIFSSIYSSTFRLAARGRLGDDRMRLMTLAEGPARLSLFRTAQVLLRPMPRTAACFAFVLHPALSKLLVSLRALKLVSLWLGAFF